MKTLHGSMQKMNGTAYFATAVSYNHKMFMKWTTGTNVIKLFTAVSYNFS